MLDFTIIPLQNQNWKIKQYLPAETVVVLLRGSEADDGIGDCCSVDRREAGDNGQDHSVLHAVVACCQR